MGKAHYQDFFNSYAARIRSQSHSLCFSASPFFFLKQISLPVYECTRVLCWDVLTGGKFFYHGNILLTWCLQPCAVMTSWTYQVVLRQAEGLQNSVRWGILQVHSARVLFRGVHHVLNLHVDLRWNPALGRDGNPHFQIP